MAKKKDFRTYLANNEHIYELLKAYAFQALAAGRKRIGIKALFERVRWHSRVEAVGDPYRINNSYYQPMAKLLMEREPALAGMFEIRKRTEKELGR